MNNLNNQTNIEKKEDKNLNKNKKTKIFKNEEKNIEYKIKNLEQNLKSVKIMLIM